VQSPGTSVRDANRRLARSEYKTGQTVLKSRPRALFVELTRHCNLACPMCRNPGEVPATLRMDASMFALVESELFPTADMIDLRGWGESLILPEFADRAVRASAYGAALRVVTNLSFRRDATLDLLADLGFYVGVSIDSADGALLSFLRGGAKLELIRANLTRLAARYRQRGISNRLNLYVTCQRPALATLERLVDLAEAVGVADIRLAPVGTGLACLSLASASSEVREALDRMRTRAERANVRISVTASLVDDMFPKDDTSACLHPWAWCYVAYNGRIGFCDHLLAADHFTFGTLGTKPFDEIWNDPAWAALRQEHLGERRPSAPHFQECAWCYRNRHVDCEDIVEPRAESKRLILVRPSARVDQPSTSHREDDRCRVDEAALAPLGGLLT
jgi:MoaA/NifB/PqqE/SkfB family radical SAM enzyme